MLQIAVISWSKRNQDGLEHFYFWQKNLLWADHTLWLWRRRFGLSISAALLNRLSSKDGDEQQITTLHNLKYILLKILGASILLTKTVVPSGRRYCVVSCFLRKYLLIWLPVLFRHLPQTQEHEQKVKVGGWWVASNFHEATTSGEKSKSDHKCCKRGGSATARIPSVTLSPDALS